MLIIFFRKVYPSAQFLKFLWNKKIITKKKNYHFSIFLNKKLLFQTFWDQGEYWKKCKNAAITSPQKKLRSHFLGFRSFWEQSENSKILSSKKLSELDFQNTPGNVNKWSFKTFFFLEDENRVSKRPFFLYFWCFEIAFHFRTCRSFF